MRIHFVSPVFFERWDWRNSVEKGIGGSETSHVEMCWRLARRGHEVISYSPLPDDCPKRWRNTEWRDLSEIEKDAKESPGLWVIYRQPAELDKFEKRSDQRIWFVCQDEAYYAHWTDERLSKIERVMALCEEHKKHMLRLSPQLAGKMCITSNGMKLDLIEEVESEGIPERDLKRLMYASSPDRGLLTLLKIFKRAREYDEELSLHCYYGCDNIDKLIEYNPKFNYYKGFVEKLKKALDQPGVIWHGRVSHKQLYKEWLKSSLWVYPTIFGESSCITSMESAAMGAIAITNPYMALKDNVKYGVFIIGNPDENELVRARYVKALLQVANSPTGQENVRKEMIPWARKRWDWENEVSLWCDWMEMNQEETEKSLRENSTEKRNRFQFQRHYSHGKVVNLGCGNDPANLKKDFKAYNIDLHAVDLVNKTENSVDLITDIREELPFDNEVFDNAILGDVLEHMSDADAIQTLKVAARISKRLVITIPEDHRSIKEQAYQHPGSENVEYIDGILAWHPRPITRDIIENWLKEANLIGYEWERLDDKFFESWGLLAKQKN